MKNGNLKSMSVEELWELHQSVIAVLTGKMAAERAKLEDRLKKLGLALSSERPRRPYPKVLPKYRNPNNGETWAGRGKQPRWLKDRLRSGRKLDDFLIRKNAA